MRATRGWWAAALLGCAGTAWAHHSFAMFDQTQRLSLHGTVHQFQWTNPHSWIYLDVPGSNGAADSWQIELNSPNNLKRQGWQSDELKAGDKVTVVINPLRDGRKGGLFVSVTLPNGTVVGDPTRRGNAPINLPSVK
ncbi:MAG TPA: DUF6152 family protein [Steroidobacteraceae bacterium]|nr:DUF6152 family protein [Steroidobacteraceae bacterium]